MPVADPPWHLSRNQMVRRGIDKPGNLRVIKRQIDILAFARAVAMAQSSEDADGRIHG